ncbi:hypothetical protein [Lactobacillus sp. wkB10]|uniref:hypothetical protein n=1 Tax=Lactobacillus sp. wkB10 TaxID=1545701 RepID=UPI00051311BA|nr:hypothetical protein [Lactobacillus sp. wkB10]KGG53264.1 hypothetical protein LACWKB10_1976 [Lactobacillus sp. wkB10]MCT6890600.1 hypothetical protein [Lactobacillus sp.]
MYYSLEDLNNFGKLDFVMQIERKSGKQAAIHFCDCMTLILNKAKHNDYFDEMNDKLSWSRIAVEHDGTPTLFCGSLLTKTFYIYTIKDNQVKREVKQLVNE